MLQSPDNKNLWEKATEDIPCTHYQLLHMDKMEAGYPSEPCLPTYLGLRHQVLGMTVPMSKNVQIYSGLYQCPTYKGVCPWRKIINFSSFSKDCLQHITWQWHLGKFLLPTLAHHINLCYYVKGLVQATVLLWFHELSFPFMSRRHVNSTYSDYTAITCSGIFLYTV